MKVVVPPKIQFKCSSCEAVNEGEPEEFEEQPTMPPSFKARCAFCYCWSICYPTALISKVVGQMTR